MIAAFLDFVPWWAWAIAAAIALAATWNLWSPLLAIIPLPIKIALAGAGAAILAYLAGRNRGAAGATAREQVAEAKAQAQSQEKINAEELGARAAGNAAAQRVRDGAAGGGDHKPG